jgi:hypothetical protein
MSQPVRIAMWSGPRNISTAMMRAFENRGDCGVVDEPFYAHYLHTTQSDHPGREKVIAAGETDWRKVAATLAGSAPDGQSIFYQKHMTHHVLPQIGHDWFAAVSHAFLIRDPRAVLLSYIKSRPDTAVSAEDIGVPQQTKLYDEIVAASALAPPVIDADEFLKNPESHLRALCAALRIAFTPRMLRWPAGPRASDGVWAPYWYDAVLKSTGFEPWQARELNVPARHRAVIDACMPDYERLRAHRLRP